MLTGSSREKPVMLPEIEGRGFFYTPALFFIEF